MGLKVTRKTHGNIYDEKHDHVLWVYLCTVYQEKQLVVCYEVAERKDRKTQYMYSKTIEMLLSCKQMETQPYLKNVQSFKNVYFRN